MTAVSARALARLALVGAPLRSQRARHTSNLLKSKAGFCRRGLDGIAGRRPDGAYGGARQQRDTAGARLTRLTAADQTPNLPNFGHRLVARLGDTSRMTDRSDPDTPLARTPRVPFLASAAPHHRARCTVPLTASRRVVRTKKVALRVSGRREKVHRISMA